MNMTAPANVKEATLSVVITRADGTVEDLGMVAYFHRNPIKRWLKKLMIWFKQEM
jgi:hypothetical protein